MGEALSVRIDESQFPERIRADWWDGLRARAVRHKFHYDSVKQTQRWLALHEALSPSRQDPGCEQAYARAYAGAVRHLAGSSVHLIGLGCGGGGKEVALLRALQMEAGRLRYTPVDVSVAMVTVAARRAWTVLPRGACDPVVADLESVIDLEALLGAGVSPSATRVITFFGMLPNFEPGAVMSKVAALVRPGDMLLVSANLAPGRDYVAGVQAILPQYDHPLVRVWLMTTLTDAGFEVGDGVLGFVVEEAGSELGVRRIAVWFDLVRGREVKGDGECVWLGAGESIRLFYSNRFTMAQGRVLAAREGLAVWEEHASPSGEEAVFVCGRVLGSVQK